MIAIVPYDKQHWEQFCRLYIETWKSEPYGERFSESDVARRVDAQDSIFVLMKGKKLIGFVAGRPLVEDCDFVSQEILGQIDPKTVFYVSELSVHEEYRSFGFGHMLMQVAFSFAKHEGYNSFLLRTHASRDNPALPLYRKLGMHTTNDGSGRLIGIPVEQERIDGRPRVDVRILFLKVGEQGSQTRCRQDEA